MADDELNDVSSPDGNLNIAYLPSDIIRQIIGMEDESIQSMRRISHRWNALSLEYLKDRKRLPEIESFSWCIDYDRAKTQMEIYVLDSRRAFFGLEKWTKIPNTDKKEIVNLERENSFSASVKKRLPNRLTRLFASCSRIGKVELDLGIERLLIDMRDLTKMLGAVPIREFAFIGLQCFDSDLKTVMDLALAHNADRVSISTETNREFAPSILEGGKLREFIVEAIGLFSSVEITMVYPSDGDFNWEETVFDLERKLKVIAGAATTKSDDGKRRVCITIVPKTVNNRANQTG
ncbi:hypothetical protein PENTCL1PPCAC_29904 [Pristionchus entomophagus]|uniref:F-box domain-containing protein n=1 Tax=Pristionchus entomophagus TaxID=358040 RepID=A0AAV5UKW4_9BILA|nr:hypothetical protein PENTCL1PPCAC_29904 [Pristionchus entomophagus]